MASHDSTTDEDSIAETYIWFAAVVMGITNRPFTLRGQWGP